MAQRARLFLFNCPQLEHVAYEDYHVAEKGLVVLSMMPGTNSEAPRFKGFRQDTLQNAPLTKSGATLRTSDIRHINRELSFTEDENHG